MYILQIKTSPCTYLTLVLLRNGHCFFLNLFSWIRSSMIFSIFSSHLFVHLQSTNAQTNIITGPPISKLCRTNCSDAAEFSFAGSKQVYLLYAALQLHSSFSGHVGAVQVGVQRVRAFPGATSSHSSHLVSSVNSLNRVPATYFASSPMRYSPIPIRAFRPMWSSPSAYSADTSRSFCGFLMCRSCF